MDVANVADTIRKAKQQPALDIWPSYDFRDIPFAVYDEQDLDYIDHPNPPTERPAHLMAATSVSINDVETATIPASMCTDSIMALAIAYHEGFHVFQKHHFAKIVVDMFTAMAFYPDLDPKYRALCRLEELVLRAEDTSAAEKLSALKQLIPLRRAQLDIHPSLLGYERYLEINEGTAHFVEQRARQALFNINPVLQEAGHGWGRFCTVGAALCWLLDETVPEWTTQLEQGKSPSDIILELSLSTVDISHLPYDEMLLREAETVSQLQRQIDASLEPLNSSEPIRIRYQDVSPQYRAFHPQTLMSLGDGRILHVSHFKLLLPSRGLVSATQTPIIDNIQAKELILIGIPVRLEDGILRAETEAIQIELTGVTQLSERFFAVIP